MKSLKIFDRRYGSVGAAFVLLVGILIPSIIPMAASAATLQARSVEMSNSAFGATSVKYTVSFTTVTAAQSIAVDFCTDSPFSGDACTAPSGMDISSATVAVPTNGIGTITPTKTVNSVLASGTTAQTGAGATVLTITGGTNPDAAGVIYARIYTYTDDGSGHVSTTSVGSPEDFGGVALDITEAIGVTAAVREKLVFCVSHSAPTATCGGTDTPALTLGEGSPKALDSTAVSTGNDYTQISTNAVSGAVVRMTNGNSCGGLHRAGALSSVCSIAPRNTIAAITAGNAFFGMLLGTPNTLSGGSGTVAPATDYAGTSGNYGMVYDNTNATGVTSPYGDTIYTTSSAPANNINVPMTFAASISNDTPAGIYSATINLVATGTF